MCLGYNPLDVNIWGGFIGVVLTELAFWLKRLAPWEMFLLC
jgi:hypothetical protein